MLSPTIAIPPPLSRRIQALIPSSASAGTVPALDGVRTLAIAMVLAFHAWFYQAGVKATRSSYSSRAWFLETGVDLFFVLSGFLLFEPYARWILGQRGAPSMAAYFRRRALRVGPAYWLCLSLLVLAEPHTLRAGLDWVLHALFLHNLTNGSATSINGVFWTMAIEVQFYVCLPFLALAVGWAARRWSPIPAVGLLVAATWALAIVTIIGHDRFPALTTRVGWAAILGTSESYYLAVFGLGMALSLANAAHAAGRTRLPLPSLARPGLGLALALALILPLTLPATSQARELLMAVAYTCLLLGLLHGPAWLSKTFAWTPIRIVGLISYSLYLWHLIVIRSLVPTLSGVPAGGPRIGATLLLGTILSLPVAYASYMVAERPFLAARRHARELDN